MSGAEPPDAFADEIFKANSAILNGLLTAINERQFDNGGQRISIPLEMMVGASNELPEDESLGALFDRFVLRRWVGYISDRDKLRGLLSSSDEPKITASLTIEQVNDLRTQTAAVTVEAVIDAVLDLREVERRLQTVLEETSTVSADDFFQAGGI